MLVYYFVPFIVSNRYLLFWVSNGHNSVTVQNRAQVYMNFFDHKGLGNHLLQLCPKVVTHPVFVPGTWMIMENYRKLPNESVMTCVVYTWSLFIRNFRIRRTEPIPVAERWRGSAVARLLRLRVRMTLDAWMFVFRECCVFARWSSLRRADPSSRGVIPSVCVCMCLSEYDRWTS